MDLSTHSLTPGVPNHSRVGPHGIRRLIRVSKRDAPSSCQRPTSMGLPPRLHLNAFQGEPAISGFAWHFTSTHRSSQPFAADLGSALHERVPLASACPWVAHPVSGRFLATLRPFGLAFAPAPRVARLASPPRTTRRLILQKARRHPNLWRDHQCRPWSPTAVLGISTCQGSDRPGARGFRICFTPLIGVLFTVPSRYWFAIGRRRYLALGGGPPRFPPDSACPAVLTQPMHPVPTAVAYGDLTLCVHPFQRCSADHAHPGEHPAGSSHRSVQPRSRIGGSLSHETGLGSSPFARRY